MLSITNYLRTVDPAVDRPAIRVPVSTRQSPHQHRSDRLQQQAFQSPEQSEREPDLSVRQLLRVTPVLVPPPTISVVAVDRSDSVRRDQVDDYPDIVTVDYGSAALENLRHTGTATRTNRLPASRHHPTANRSSNDLADLPVVELKPFTSNVWRPSRSYSANKVLRINDAYGSTASREDNERTSVFRVSGRPIEQGALWLP